MKTIWKITAAAGAAAAGLTAAAWWKKPSSVYEDEPAQKNPLEGKKTVFVPDGAEPENADGERGHLEAAGPADTATSLYDRCGKRLLDAALSLFGLLLLSPLLLALTLAIKVDDPGPALFTQKRIGRNKQYFKLHKFRSMKRSAPHNVPTHMLSNPEQYITRVGKFIRRFSLDELPQLWDIFLGNMSVIGPRPALWNQDILTAERDKYGANDVKPGLTGWAQINGRDENSIPEKARLDGDYTRILKKGGLGALLFDCRCFLGTVFSVARGDGIVEGSVSSILGSEDPGSEQK